MKRAPRSRLFGRARGLLVTLAAVSLLYWLGVFRTTELSAVNAAFNLRGPRSPSAPIVIIAVDQESFDQTGLQWPWPRDYLARIVNNLSAGKPKVIVLDAFFYEADLRPGTDPVLGEALKRAGNVVVTNDILQRSEDRC